MITRKQWDAFLTKIAILKNNGFHLTIGDRKVVHVDIVKEKAVWTSDFQKDYTGKMVRIKYTYIESVDAYMNLDDLYNKISVRNVTLADVYRGDLREIREDTASITFQPVHI